MSKQVKNKKVFKNGAIGGYVKQNDGSWKWRIIGNIKKKQNGGGPNHIYNSVKSGNYIDVSSDESFAIISAGNFDRINPLIYHINLTTGKILETFSLPTSINSKGYQMQRFVFDIKISPDMSCFFVSVFDNGRPIICTLYKITFNSKETTLLYSYNSNTGSAIQGLAVLNDMSFIFIASLGNIIRINLETLETNIETQIQAMVGAVKNIILSNDNQFALVTHYDNKSVNTIIYKVNLNKKTKKLSTNFSKIYSSNNYNVGIKLSYDDLSIFILINDFSPYKICKLNLTNPDNCLSIYSGNFRNFAITSNFLLLLTSQGIELNYLNIKNFNTENINQPYPESKSRRFFNRKLFPNPRTWLTNSKNMNNNGSDDGGGGGKSNNGAYRSVNI